MAQAGLSFGALANGGSNRKAGLSEPTPEPLTMEDRQSMRDQLFDEGYSPYQVRQLLGGTVAPEPEIDDDGAGIGTLLGAGTRRFAGSTIESIGEFIQDRTGADALGEGIEDFGEAIGPTEEQEQALAERAEGRSTLGKGADAIVQEAPGLAATIAAGAATGAAAGAVFGPGAVATGLAGAVTGGIGWLRLRNENRDKAIDSVATRRKAIDLYGEREHTPEELQAAASQVTDADREAVNLDAETLNKVDATAALTALPEAFAPLRAVNRIGKPAQQAAMRKIIGTAAKEGGKDAMIEGLTEVMQMATTEAVFDPALRAQLTQGEVNEIAPYVKEMYGEDLMVAFIAGTGLGAAAGGTTGAYQQSVTNARAKNNIAALTAAAEASNISPLQLEEAAKDPEKAPLIAEGASEIAMTEGQYRAAKDAYIAAASNPESDPDVVAALEDRVQRAEDQRDAAYDKVMVPLGGMKAADVRRQEKAENTRKRSEAITNIGQGGERVSIKRPVDTADLVNVSEELTPLRDKRERLEELLAGAQKAKRRNKALKKLTEAIEAEGRVRGKIAQITSGADPVQAQNDWVDSAKDRVNAEVVGAAKRRQFDAEVADETELQGLGSEVDPDTRRTRAEAIIRDAEGDVVSNFRYSNRDQARADLRKLQRRLARTDDPAQREKLKNQIRGQEAKLQPTMRPAVVAAQQALQELDAEAVPSEEGMSPQAGLSGDANDPSTDDGARSPEDEGVAAPEFSSTRQPVEVVEDGTFIPNDDGLAAAAALDMPDVDMSQPIDGTKPENYFEMDDNSTMLPIGDLRPVRAREKGIRNAGVYMRAAAEGKTGKRAPLTVRDEGDGTFTVIDGNSTYANMVENGWENVPVNIIDDQIAPDDPRRVNDDIDRQRRWKDHLDTLGANAKLGDAEALMIEMKPDVEWLAAFDAETGEIEAFGTNNSPDGVAIPRRGKPLIVTHTHPEQTPFSDADITLAMSMGIPEMRAVLPTGQVISMSPTNNSPLTVMAAQTMIYEAADPIIDVLVRNMPPRMATTQRARIKQETLLRMLELNGDIEYTTPIEGLTSIEEEIINATIDIVTGQSGDSVGLRNDEGAPTAAAFDQGGPAGPAGAQFQAALAQTGAGRRHPAAVNINSPSPEAFGAAEREFQSVAADRYSSWDDLVSVLPDLERRFEEANRAVSAETGAHFSMGPRKQRDRTEEKARQKDREGRVGRIGDVVRGSFVTDNPIAADNVVNGLIGQGFDVLDAGWMRNPAGYMDRKLMLVDPETDVMTEVQIVDPAMYRAKSAKNPYTGERVDGPKGHDLYKQMRSTADPEEKARLANEMRDLYASAMQGSNPQMLEVYQSLDPLSGRPLTGADFPAVAQAMDGAGRVSTRFPTNVSREFDPLVDVEQVTTASMRAHPENFDFNMETIRTYDFWNGGDMDADATAEAFKNHVVENLLFLHDQFEPEVREATSRWYDGARKIVGDWSQRYGVQPEEVAGVMAALSPQKDWFMNLSLAERVLDITQFAADQPWSAKMTATANRIFGKPQYADDMGLITGKSLSQLSDPVQKAMWVRIYDETYNPRTHRDANTDGRFLGDNGKKVAWSPNAINAKAISIIDNPTVENISSQLGNNHKVRSFYNNIIAPMATEGDVTIDTHAVGAGLMMSVSQASPEVSHNFGVGLGKKNQPEGYRPPRSAGFSGAKGMYGLYADAYREAAAQRGILPRQMQSITWEAVRTLFPAGWKNAQRNEAVRDIWRRYADGEIDGNAAREEIVGFAGGVPAPAWVRSDAGPDGQPGDTSYESGVPEVVARKSERGAGAGRGGDAAGAAAANQPDGPRIAANFDRALDGAGAAAGGDTGGGLADSQPVGRPAADETAYREVDAEEFVSAARRALDQMGPIAAQVGTEAGDVNVLLDEGLSGYALSDGNITSVFSSPGSPKGVARRVLADAVRRGGNRLDGFDTFLPVLYADNGFRAVARLPFNDEYAPRQDSGSGADWDYGFFERKYGNPRPDVVFMVYDPDNASAETDNVVSDYDAGIAAQEAARNPEGSVVYVRRDVQNGDAIVDWAEAQGFTDVLPAEDMHVTVAYSRNPVETNALSPDSALEQPVAINSVKPMAMAEGNALALPVESDALQAGHQRWRDAGASHDFPDYRPHVTFKYDPTPEELALAESAEPFTGEIELGPEIREDRPAVARNLSGGATYRTPDAELGQQTADWIDSPGGRPAARILTKEVAATLNSSKRPRDKVNDLRHKHSDYDRDSVFAAILDGGFGGPVYKRTARYAADQMRDYVKMGAPALQRGEMNVIIDEFQRSKERQNRLPMNEERARRVFREMGRLISEGRMTEMDIGRELKVTRERARTIYNKAVASYPQAAAVARAIDAPPGLDIAPQAKATWSAMNYVAQNPMDVGRSLGQKLEDNFFNRFAPIRRLEEGLREKAGLGKTLAVGMDSAFKMAETAVNDSGRTEGLMYYGASKLGQHGEYTHADGTVGLRTIFDTAAGDATGEARGQDMADWMGYMVAKRIDELRKAGNTMPFPMSDADVQTYLKKETPAMKEAAEMWRKHNEANVDFLVDTGRINKAQAKALKQTASYVPFYRSENNADGSSPDLDLTNLRKFGGGGELMRRDPNIKALKGGDKKAIDNIMLNMIRNSQAMTAAGMRNRAANMTMDLMETAGLATTVKGTPSKKPDPNALKVWRNGKEKWVVPQGDDAMPLIVAMQGLQPLQLGRIQSLLGGIGAIFRQGITLSPAFMIRNAIRGAVSSGLLTSGANLTVKNNTATGFWDAYNVGPATQAFKAQSGMGDYSFGNPSTGLGANDILAEYGLAPKTLAYRIRKAIEAGERVGTATELADRVAAYKTMITPESEGGAGIRPDEAAYQARAIMDYARKGSLPELRAWLPMVPFLNARLQGFSRMAEGAVGRRGATGRKQALKQLGLNGLVLLGLSAMLWARNAFDEERKEQYKSEPLHRRLNYHIVYLGDKTLLIPKAFELGHIFSSIPELFGDKMVNNMDELGVGPKKIIMDTVGMNLIPAAALPIIEGAANYSFFMGRPIDGRRESDMMARDRVSGASSAAQMLGRDMGISDATSLSPNYIQHYLEGYGGTYFATLSSALDIIAGELGYGSAPVGGAFGDVTGVSQAAQRMLGSMWRDTAQNNSKYVEDFYRNREYITQIMRSAKAAAAVGDVEYARRILNEAPAAPAAYKMMNKASSRIGDLNSAIREIKGNRDMTPKQKRDRITPLIRERNRMVKAISELVDRIEEKQGATFKSVV